MPAWRPEQWLDAMPPVLAALGLDLGARQRQQLADYMVLLAHWNSTFNLTALRDPADMLTHHLADCLAVLPPLAHGVAQHVKTAARLAGGAPPESPPEGTEPRAASTQEKPAGPLLRLLDVGSGGGLPGVVIAIAKPDLHVSCVDTVGKKAAFIRQAGAELGLSNLRSEHARVEQLPGRYNLITSRAFASLADFVGLTQSLLLPGGVWMALKGKRPDEEMAQLPANVEVFHVEHINVPGLDAERCIVWMRQRIGPNAG